MRTLIAMAAVLFLALPAKAQGVVRPFYQIDGVVQIRGDGSIVLKTGPGVRDFKPLTFTTFAVETRLKGANTLRVRVKGYWESEGPRFSFEVGDFKVLP